MNFNINDIDSFKNKKFKLSKKVKIGVLTAAIIVGGMFAFNNKSNDRVVISELTDNDTFYDQPESDVVDADLTEINSHNIIINSVGKTEMELNDIYNMLREKGINFSTSENYSNVSGGDIVINLDYNYSNSEGINILNPYNDFGNCYALSLACNSSFTGLGFTTSAVDFGKVDFNDNYRITNTDIEEHINAKDNVSTTTIAIGGNQNSTLLANAIEGSLVRYCNYLRRGIGSSTSLNDVSAFAEFDSYSDTVLNNNLSKSK